MRSLAITMLLPCIALAQGTAPDYERATRANERFQGKVSRDRVEPHWLEDGHRFWYQVDLPEGKKEYFLVDAKKAEKRAISAEDRKELKEAKAPAAPPRQGRRNSNGRSPDEKWVAFLKDDNIWVRDTKTEKIHALSKDGTEDHPYIWPAFWSPDSQKLVVMRQKKGGNRKVTLVESSPRDQLQPKTRTLDYLKPGDDIPLRKPHLFNIASLTEIPVPDTLFPNPWAISHEHWTPDSRAFFFVYNQRGHQVVRVVSLDATSGKSTAIVNEECKTFFDYANKLHVTYIDATDELIWMSERSGWNHLYLISMKDGTIKNSITKGEWLVRGVEKVDLEKRQVWCRVMGRSSSQDPYHVHDIRIGFDGTGLTELTEGDGTHTLSFSPDREFYIDSYSRVDAPPIHELRSSHDGKRLLSLEKADISRLAAEGWIAPERFVSKGRDGKTDIWGYVIRPSNYDPNKKYRVIESIYAGPHGHHVGKTFRPTHYETQMAELGFIVVRMDGMGTNWRSKAFHDVCWKNLGDSGFPDRIAWIKALAKKYPNFEIQNGVGIYGGSAGGQSTLRGMTEYPDFYTVGVSDCGCHDNRMDKIWWNELWMSWPIGPHYAEQSNVTNAHKLKGKLLLVVGEQDTNVDPASTMQVVNALIKADKDFDLLVVPGGGHGIAESRYGRRRRMDFFVRHLLGVEPRSQAKKDK